MLTIFLAPLVVKDRTTYSDEKEREADNSDKSSEKTVDKSSDKFAEKSSDSDDDTVPSHADSEKDDDPGVSEEKESDKKSVKKKPRSGSLIANIKRTSSKMRKGEVEKKGSDSGITTPTRSEKRYLVCFDSFFSWLFFLECTCFHFLIFF